MKSLELELKIQMRANKYYICITFDYRGGATPAKKSDDDLPAEYLASPLSKQPQVIFNIKKLIWIVIYLI